MSASALQGFPSPQVTQALLAASAEADSYLSKAVLPLAYKGTWGATTFVGTGPSTAVAFTGTPPFPTPWVVEIVAGGTLGVSTFQLSQDGGNNFGPVQATATSVAVGATVITFAAGTYVAGDEYSSNPATTFQGWGMDLTKQVAAIAAWDLLRTGGFNPEKGSDVTIRMAKEDADSWFSRVSKGQVKPSGPGPDGTLVDSNPSPPVNASTAQAGSGTPFNVTGQQLRGW